MFKRMQKTLIVSIQQDLFEFLENLFGDKNKIPFKEVNLNKDHIIYFFYLMETLESYSFTDNNNDIHLHSRKLIKEFSPKYKSYIEFMIDHKFIIKVKNYRVGKHTNIYRFNSSYPQTKTYKKFNITNITLIKKINSNNSGTTEDKRKKNKKASRVRSHLTKGFNDNLKIDYNSCLDLLSDMDTPKYRPNFITLFNFHNKYWNFSIKKETDNRLHTLLTRLNKKFLKHISYKNESLAEVDIKTSQPIFLYAVLNVIFNDKNESDFKNKVTEKLGKQVIKDILNAGIEHDELIKFGEIIMNHDLYNYLSDNLVIEKTNNKYSRFEFDKKSKSKRLKTYDNKRDLTKKIVMETLYSSPKNYASEVTQIKKLFPSIFKIVDFIKSSMNDKNGFPVFLQQIEAEVLLDEIGGMIVKQKSDIILFSKHDSLISTESNIDFLKKIMEEQLKFYLLIEKVKVEISHWN